MQALTLLDTTIGKKAALAVSGLVLFGFVIGHMLGNLQVFLGAEVFNAYAAALKGTPALLWGVRSVLILAIVVHVMMTVQLYARSLAARPARYHQTHSVVATYASTTMKFSGPILLFFILFHIAHLTAPGLELGDYAFSATDAYGNFVNGFKLPWVTGLYCVANLFLGLHLYHGAWSLLQSLGLNHPRYNARRKAVAQVVALVITGGNVLMPLAVLAGIVS